MSQHDAARRQRETFATPPTRPSSATESARLSEKCPRRFPRESANRVGAVVFLRGKKERIKTQTTQVAARVQRTRARTRTRAFENVSPRSARENAPAFVFCAREFCPGKKSLSRAPLFPPCASVRSMRSCFTRGIDQSAQTRYARCPSERDGGARLPLLESCLQLRKRERQKFPSGVFLVRLGRA